MERWGKDHWSALAYIETRVTDHGGRLDHRHMRDDGEAYPTRLANGELRGHDDYECLNDMEVAGLVVARDTGTFPVASLTALGWAIAGRLREHRGRGRPYRDFRP